MANGSEEDDYSSRTTPASSTMAARWAGVAGLLLLLPLLPSASSMTLKLDGDVYPNRHFYVTLNIGDPKNPYFLDIDTGSSLTWLECNIGPCTKCHKVPHDLYKPKKLIHCEDPLFIAWTVRPEFIPSTRTLTVPEPNHFDGPFEPMRRTLKYKVHIQVRRLLVRFPPDSPPPSPPPPPPTDHSSEDDSPAAHPKRRRRSRGRSRHGRRGAALEDTPSPDEGGAAAGMAVDAAAPVRELRRSTGNPPAPLMTVAPHPAPQLPEIEEGRLAVPGDARQVGPNGQAGLAEVLIYSLEPRVGFRPLPVWDPMLDEASRASRRNPSPAPLAPRRGDAEAIIPGGGSQTGPVTPAQDGLSHDDLGPAQSGERCMGDVDRVQAASAVGAESDLGLGPLVTDRSNTGFVDLNPRVSPTRPVDDLAPAQAFLDSVTRSTGASPILLSTPPRRPRNRRARPVTMAVRRSRRIAAAGYTNNSIQRAQALIMKRLGITPPVEQLTTEAAEAYARLFDHPLTSAQIAALAGPGGM
ncbi:hypothetical protein EJB05_28736, partial [Eragrostis curvula]